MSNAHLCPLSAGILSHMFIKNWALCNWSHLLTTMKLQAHTLRVPSWTLLWGYMDSQVHCQVVASVGIRTHMPTVPISTPQEKHSQAHFSDLNSVKCVTTKYMMVSVGTSTHMPTDIKHSTETHIDRTWPLQSCTLHTKLHMPTFILHSKKKNTNSHDHCHTTL